MTLKSALPSAAHGPSCLLMSPLQASALNSAYSFVNDDNSDNDSDSDLEDLSFVEPQPLMMKRRVRLDYVSDYEWDEDNDYLEDYDSDDDATDDDACSVDSEMTLTVSNRAYDLYHGNGKLSPVSSSTNSTATIDSDCCSIHSSVSFDSEVAVSKHHQPTPVYHHRQSSSSVVQTPSSAEEKEARHSFSSVPSAYDKSRVKKPFVRADLMPTPLSSSSSSQQLLVSPSSPCSKGEPISRRLFRTSSCKTI